MVFHRARMKNKDFDTSIVCMNGMKLERTDCFKYLGVNLYYSYIYPYFIYCIEVWGNASHCHLHPLFLLQKEIFRIMTFSPYYAHTETLPLDKLIFNRIAIMI